jgi:SAM-dependent methyltransferase
MSLASEYKRQLGWRAWPAVFDALPPLGGQTVLDLGCGVGDQAAELVTRGAYVIGIDSIENAEFRKGDLRALMDLDFVADGLWGGFIAAYFPDLPAALELWKKHLRPGGWVALTEIDDLFGHEPVGAGTRSLLEAYAGDAFAAGRYDFHMGGKLRDHLERSGFKVAKELTLADQEFSFDGPAGPEVVDGWRSRIDRMKLLQDFCGPDFEQVREEFLGCLTRADHRSLAKVVCCIATR